MIYLFLADGFEEIEALAPVDILRRGGKDVKTVAVKGKKAVGTHGIAVECDITIDEVKDDMEMLILPGGMPGTKNLAASEKLISLVKEAFEKGIYIGAICAAPSVLGEIGILKGKKATCFPGFEGYLNCAEISDDFVVVDENVITAKGAGVALEFGFALLKQFDPDFSDKLRKDMQCI